MAKVVFNGSDLGKAYSADAVIDALQFKISGNDSSTTERVFEKTGHVSSISELTIDNATGRSLMDELLNPLNTDQGVPNQFGPKKKKKRRKLNL